MRPGSTACTLPNLSAYHTDCNTAATCYHEQLQSASIHSGVSDKQKKATAIGAQIAVAGKAES